MRMMIGVMGLVCFAASGAGVLALAAEQDHAVMDQVVSTGTEGYAGIEATDPNSPLKGSVHLTEKDGGLQVEVEVFDVPGSGARGFHIHENGSCEDQGKAAGGHYNPMGVQHGFLPKDGEGAAHMGDMGNIDIDDNGHGTLSVFLPGLSLVNGIYDVNGRAVILHEKADDFGQPTGNAGGRIGCGIIAVASKS